MFLELTKMVDGIEANEIMIRLDNITMMQSVANGNTKIDSNVDGYTICVTVKESLNQIKDTLNHARRMM